MMRGCEEERGSLRIDQMELSSFLPCSKRPKCPEKGVDSARPIWVKSGTKVSQR
jgi:hypothetical protein